MAIVKRVISGGQLGADHGGLEGAWLLGIPTGGMMPATFRTEAGSRPDIAAKYGLLEHDSYAYPPRTEVNVAGSDGTIIFGDAESAGSALTIELCSKYKKPVFLNPTPAELRQWCIDNHIEVLNVAGNRESKFPGIFVIARDTVMEAFYEPAEQGLIQP